jgi:broad specificity phosphatase PhoE
MLIRHAESKFNEKSELRLTKLGKKQAKITAEFLKDKDIEAVYSSDSKRALDTANEISKKIKKKIIRDKRLKEYQLELDKDNTGKTKEKHIKMMKSFLEEITKKHKGTVVVVSHSGKIELGINLLLNKRIYDNFQRIYQYNTAINEFIFEEGVWKTISLNKISHTKIHDKPARKVYKNQDKIYLLIKKKVLSELPPKVKEAYLFGSSLNKQFGKYEKKWGRHEGSNINVLLVLDNVGYHKWRYIQEGKFWTIYEAGKLKIDDTTHLIDFFVINKKLKYKAVTKLNNLGWRLVRIR